MLLWFCPNCALYIRYGLRKILGKFGFPGKNGLSRKNFRSWKFPKWPPGVLLGSGLSPKKISAGFTIHRLQTPPDTITFLLVLLLSIINHLRWFSSFVENATPVPWDSGRLSHLSQRDYTPWPRSICLRLALWHSRRPSGHPKSIITRTEVG